MDQQDPNELHFTNQPIPPHLRDDHVITNSPLNPNHPSSKAYPGAVPLKKSHKLRTALIILGVLTVGLVSCTALVGGVLSQTPSAVTAGAGKTTEVPTVEPSAPVTSEPVAKPTKAAPKLTVGQAQALGSAESYLDSAAFSRKGLIRQLTTFEGYSVADATYAVDHVKVNWNDQAAKSARSYLEFTHFSRAGLIRQLETFDKYTHRQAVYGVSKAGL